MSNLYETEERMLIHAIEVNYQMLIDGNGDTEAYETNITHLIKELKEIV